MMPTAPWPPNPKPPPKVDTGVIGFWLLVFALVCFLTSFMLAGAHTGGRSFHLNNGGISDAFTTDRPNQILTVSFRQDLPVQKWSFPEIQVLDRDKEYLFSFGDEFWHESGVDADGYWRESYDDTALDFVLPEPGVYYLSLALEGHDSSVRVTMERSGYSAVPHFVAGLAAFVAGLVLAKIANRRLVPFIQVVDND